MDVLRLDVFFCCSFNLLRPYAVNPQGLYTESVVATSNTNIAAPHQLSIESLARGDRHLIVLLQLLYPPYN